MGEKMGAAGRTVQEGKYVYTWLIHFIVQQKLQSIVTQLYPNFKNKNKTSKGGKNILKLFLSSVPLRISVQIC